jgi:hypothetical protein
MRRSLVSTGLIIERVAPAYVGRDFILCHSEHREESRVSATHERRFLAGARMCGNCHFDAKRGSLFFDGPENARSLSPFEDDKIGPDIAFPTVWALAMRKLEFRADVE